MKAKGLTNCNDFELWLKELRSLYYKNRQKGKVWIQYFEKDCCSQLYEEMTIDETKNKLKPWKKNATRDLNKKRKPQNPFKTLRFCGLPFLNPEVTDGLKVLPCH